MAAARMMAVLLPAAPSSACTMLSLTTPCAAMCLCRCRQLKWGAVHVETTYLDAMLIASGHMPMDMHNESTQHAPYGHNNTWVLFTVRVLTVSCCLCVLLCGSSMSEACQSTFGVERVSSRSIDLSGTRYEKLSIKRGKLPKKESFLWRRNLY